VAVPRPTAGAAPNHLRRTRPPAPHPTASAAPNRLRRTQPPAPRPVLGAARCISPSGSAW